MMITLSRDNLVATLYMNTLYLFTQHTPCKSLEQDNISSKFLCKKSLSMMATPDNDTTMPLLSSKQSPSPYGAVPDQGLRVEGALDEVKESVLYSTHNGPEQQDNEDIIQKTTQSSPGVNLPMGHEKIDQPEDDDEYPDEEEPLLTRDAKEASQYLKEALEECSTSNKETCTCNCNIPHIESIDCCRKSPFKLESIKKAKKIGIKVIMKTVLRNLFHKAIYREVFIYLSVVSLLLSTSISVVKIVQDSSGTRNESITQNEIKEENFKILKTFDYISFGVNVLGLIFVTCDLSLHLRHRGCRVLKRTCKCQELVQPGDEEKAECFNDSCACKGTCGKGCTTVMDIVRIVVLETIFYPNLLLNIFKVIVMTTKNDSVSESDSMIYWITAILNFLSVIIFVYIKKTYIFFRVICSIRKVKTRVNKKFREMTFIINFFMYKCALMFLQLLMIIIIVSRFHYEYKENTEKNQKNAIENSWQLWYMMIFAYLMPLIGMPMFFLVHQFWTSKLPVDVVRDLMSELQTKGKGGDRNKNKTDKMVEQVMNHLGNDQFRDDYTKFKKITLFEKLAYPCISPLRVAAPSLYVGAFFVFFVGSMYDRPTDNEWLGFHIAVAIIAYFINIYAASIAAYCIFLFIASVYICFAIIYLIYIISIVVLVCLSILFVLLLILVPLSPIIAFYCLHNSKYSRNPKSPCYGI